MTRLPFVLGARALVVDDVVAASRGPMRVALTPEGRARLGAARAVVERHMALDVPVYGLNTGLGGNAGHRIAPADMSTFQEQVVRGRVAGIGEPLPVEACRAVLFCRIAGLAAGGSGVSPDVFDRLAAMLERDVVPVIPSRGSLGASDLVLLMSLAAVAIGRGDAYFGGRRMPAADALRAVSLSPVELGAKDGLALGSASSVTSALAALSLAAARDAIRVHVAVAALSCEGYAADPRIFDPRLATARPAALQVEAASLFRRALDGAGEPAKAGRVQDPLSFRTLPQVTGALLAAFGTARDEVETELNAVADSPLVLAEAGEIHSTANFHTPAIALAFDTLTIAMAHVASASAQRSIKLMTGRLSGLPNYLSPVGGASAGFVPMQKTVAALHAEIRMKAQPASLDALVVSDMQEDVAPQTTLAIRMFEEQLALVRWLISMEAMFAAQAVGLRLAAEPGRRLGAAARVLQPLIRAVVPELVEDRETGPDVAVLHGALWAADTIAALGDIVGV